MIVKLDVLIAKKVIIDRDAESFPPFSNFNCSIALIPNGVAALPKPNMICNHIG